jgi:AcrR family transcriptional regulator
MVKREDQQVARPPVVRKPRAAASRRTAAATKLRSPRPSPAADRRLRTALEANPPQLQQDRAKRSYLALLDAAERLFGRDGYDAVGTPEIAAEAGVSVGTFYRYFVDKKQAYLEVARRCLRDAYHDTLDRLTPELMIGEARGQTIERTVAVLFDYVHRHPGLNRVLVETSLRDPDVAALRVSFERAACQRIAALVAAICPTSQVPDPEATAWVVLAACLECAIRSGGGQGTLAMDATRVRRALAAMIERLLFSGAPSSAVAAPGLRRRGRDE